MKKHQYRAILILLLSLTLFSFARMPSFAGEDPAGAKEAILQGIENRAARVELERYTLSRDRVSELFRLVLDENPRFYYVENCVIWTEEDTATGLSLQYLAGFGKEEDAAYEAAVKKALGCVRSDMSDMEKALVLHDWLRLNTAYDYSNYQNGTAALSSYTSYGALVLGASVCDGYSRAYQDLLTRLGIPCKTVRSSRMNHSWNRVYLDGSWYNVDVTWDDPSPDEPGKADYTCFLKSDSAFRNLGTRSHNSSPRDSLSG